MQDDDSAPTRTVRGHVKWFDPAKGFGFVVSEEGGRDILLHGNVLRTFGQSTVADGSAIELKAQETQRGVQAVEVISIVPPAGGVGSGLSDLAGIDPAELAARPIEPARVKWFDKAKGFGFANVFGQDDDVFIHIEVLRKSGLSDLQPGEAVGMRSIEGRRGLMAVEVLAWDAAGRGSGGETDSGG
ncbi:cold-shock protein [Wenxinia marina]|uniref:Cold-shock DNA-binding protein family n=1 Tax=Wenxinia marina DSM 24838 TaxID=1123501 RepID=A0A0D0PBS4_9RHOB|nr:cold shock domain-containing protein [Wenxinia marina]KIQ68911.1 cold-shock DNA-binding protein family [Wenxinia marina DSM 24838]GGL64237.1 cold-shock protein [Wenxinia marina]